MDSISECKHITGAAKLIRDEIARAGVLSFARFMELALYHADHGYYRHLHIGKSGDFFTSVSVGALFGQMLAFYLADEFEKIPGQLQLVEAGANDGTLAWDILTWLRENRPALAARLTYWIIEPFPELRRVQQQKLSSFSARWFSNIDELPVVRGAFISNELLDAFPVHFFRWNKQQKRWFEFGVDRDFNWAVMPSLPEWSLDALAEGKPLQPYLPDGFTIEFSPAAEAWWGAAAMKLQEGLLMAFDYGKESIDFWSPSNPHGTLRAYRHHRLVDDPLANPGKQDLTASVNFTRIRAAGERAGLQSRLETQSRFFTNLAPKFCPAPEQSRQFQTLTHPEHLGNAFKILIQSRINS